MASSRHPATIEILPCEVLSEILMRLLAKQLAQLRCVSKSWNALLSTSCFIKSHLHYSIDNNDDILMFFRQGFSFKWRPFTTGPTSSLDLDLKLTKNMKLPLNLQSKYGRVIGSMNGLICFCCSAGYSPCVRDYVVFICNPSLSMVLTLPPSSFSNSNSMDIHFRFGFDPKTDDYKVVKLASLYKRNNMLPEVEVYSMRKGSWELITERFPSHITIIRNNDKVCVDGRDGHLHWLRSFGSEWKPQTIVALDLHSETFSEIPLPDFVPHPHEDRLDVLGVLAGKLCLMSFVKHGECDIWVMDEYGVAESWVKHHVFTHFRRYKSPLGFTLRNKFLFHVHYDSFVLYDQVAALTKFFFINAGFDIDKVVEYVDSLVWVAPVADELSNGGISC